jgi:hypothetical protein
MVKGCVGALVLLALLWALEVYLLEAHGISHPWWVPWLLALGVTVSFLNLWGIMDVLRLKRLAAQSLVDWHDGAHLCVSGILKPLRRPLKAPITNQDVVAYEYHVKEQQGTQRNRTHKLLYSGFGLTRAAISTPRGPLMLSGISPLNFFSASHRSIKDCVPQLAHHFATATFRRETFSFRDAVKLLNELRHDEDGEVLLNCAYPEAHLPVRVETEIDVQDADGSLTSTFESRRDLNAESSSDRTSHAGSESLLTQALSMTHGQVKESCIPAGVEVTAYGIFRSNPARLDIGDSLTKTTHGLFKGPMSQVIRGKLIAATFAFLLFTCLTVVGHLFAFELKSW